MAQLAVAAIGAGIGGWLAPGVVGLGMTGAAIGWMAGSVVGAVLFAPDAPDGPRIADKGVRVGSYGRMIPIVGGTVRVTADVIWASDLIESADEVGGGWGSDGATVYSYSINMLVQVCESPQDNPVTPMRIWANGRLIWTNDATPEGMVDTGVLGTSSVRWYAGQYGQEPDPVYEAAVTDAPAHLGTLTIMFEGMNLEFSGFRPPTIEVEVTRGETDSTQNSIYTAAIWHGIGETTTIRAAGYLVMLRHSPTSPYTVVRWVRDSDGTVTGEVEVPFGYLSNLELLVDPTSGRTWVWRRSGADSTLYAYDPNGSLVLGPEAIDDVTMVDMHMTHDGQLLGRGMYPEKLLRITETGGGIAVDITMPSLTLYEAAAIIGSAVGVPSEVLVWWGMTIWTIDTGGDFPAYWPQDLGLYFDTVQRAWWDYRAQEYIVVGTIDSEPSVARIAYGTFDLIAAHPISQEMHDAAYVDSGLSLDVRRRYLWMPGTATVSGVNYYTGIESTDLYEYTPTGAANEYRVLPSDTGGALRIAWNQSGGPDFFYAELGGAVGAQSIGLGALVEMLCNRCDVYDVDVSELTDEVLGYSLTTRTTARAAIDQLRAAYFFDAVESGGTLAFRKRGAAAVATIAVGELGATQFSPNPSEVPPARKLETIPDVDAPYELSLSYVEQAADYDVGLATARMQTTYSTTPVNVELPIVMSAEEAGTIAWRNLLYAHAARCSISIALSHRYAALEPTDAILVPFADGEDRRMRIDRVSYERPRIELDGVIEDVSYMDVPFVGTARVGVPSQSAAAAGLVDAEMVVLDLPPLQDEDSLAVYVGAGPADGG